MESCVASRPSRRGDNVKGQLALRLRSEQGMSLRAIAQELGMTTGGVSNAMRRAGATFRNYHRSEAVTDKAERPTDLDSRRVDRDPCLRCAVPADRHHEHGCRSYRRP